MPTDPAATPPGAAYLRVRYRGEVEQARDALFALGPMPHRCPVCVGTGRVSGATYDFVPLGYPLIPVPCRPCEGTGVVWR